MPSRDVVLRVRALGARESARDVDLIERSVHRLAGLDFNAKFEQSQVAFTNLLGPQQQARSMLTPLYDLAARTPFEMQPLVAPTQKLLGFGMSAEKVLSTMTAIGDRDGPCRGEGDRGRRAGGGRTPSAPLSAVL